MFISDASAAEAMANAQRNLLPDTPTDYGLGYQRAFDDTRYRLLSDSGHRARFSAYDDYIDQIQKSTGQRLVNPVPAADLDGVDSGMDDQSRLADFHDKVAKLNAAHPDLKTKSDTDILADITAKAHGLKDAADAESRGVNLGWAGLGRFAGGAAAMMTDPINIAALFLGSGPGAASARANLAARATLMERLGAAGAEISTTAAREGAVNAAATMAAQPAVMEFNRSVGIHHGSDEVVGDVAMAAVGGAVLGGGLKIIGLGGKALLDRWKAAKASGKVAEDLTSRDAEAVLDAQVAHDQANPFPPTPEGSAAHDAAMAEALRAMLRGEPADPAILRQFQDHRVKAIGDLAARSEGSIDTTGTSDLVIYGVIHPDQASIIAPKVKEMLGRDDSLIDHAARKIDRDGINHAVKDHGSDQIPFHPQDAAHIPDVVESGQLVEITRDHSTSSPFILWRKLVNGNWLYVGEEAVGEKRTMLRMKTAYWTQGPKDRGGNTRGGSPEGTPPQDARFAYSMPDEPQAHVRSVGDGPVTDTIAPSAPKSKRAAPAPWPDELRPPSEGRPQTLVDWLKAQGGVNDAEGWLANMGVTNKARPGLIRGEGLHLDDAALYAHDAGFFPDLPDRPSPDILRAAIADELDGLHARHRPSDDDLAARWRDHERLVEELDRAGVNPAGKSFDQVAAEVKAYHAAQRASEEGFARTLRDFLSDIRPDLDHEKSLVSEMRGHLMGDDIAIPSGLTDAEGNTITVSARNSMDDLDHEFMAWDSAFSCLSK